MKPFEHPELPKSPSKPGGIIIVNESPAAIPEGTVCLTCLYSRTNDIYCPSCRIKRDKAASAIIRLSEQPAPNYSLVIGVILMVLAGGIAVLGWVL